MTARPPLSSEQDPLERRYREERAARTARRRRVERAGLEDCPACGGTTDEVEDETLRCTCAERLAALRARVARHAYEARVGSYSDDSDRIVR